MTARGKYRTVVVVFVTADGVDERDAGHAAVLAVRTALGGDQMRLPVALTRQMRDFTIEAEVVDVQEAGMAAGNGYLWTRPTSKAWSERDL